jgi:hypothetical protein
MRANVRVTTPIGPLKKWRQPDLPPPMRRLSPSIKIIPSSWVCFSALLQALLTNQMTLPRFIVFTPNSFGLGCEGSKRKATRTIERRLIADLLDAAEADRFPLDP